MIRFNVTDLLLTTAFLGAYLGPIGSLMRLADIGARDVFVVAGVLFGSLVVFTWLQNRSRFGRPWLRLPGRRSWVLHFCLSTAVVAACLQLSKQGSLLGEFALLVAIVGFVAQLNAILFPDTCFYGRHVTSVYGSHSATPDSFTLHESPKGASLALLKKGDQIQREWPIPAERLEEVRAILAEKQGEEPQMDADQRS